MTISKYFPEFCIVVSCIITTYSPVNDAGVSEEPTASIFKVEMGQAVKI
jgi:hypothetical protein